MRFFASFATPASDADPARSTGADDARRRGGWSGARRQAFHPHAECQIHRIVPHSGCLEAQGRPALGRGLAQAGEKDRSSFAVVQRLVAHITSDLGDLAGMLAPHLLGRHAWLIVHGHGTRLPEEEEAARTGEESRLPHDRRAVGSSPLDVRGPSSRVGGPARFPEVRVEPSRPQLAVRPQLTHAGEIAPDDAWLVPDVEDEAERLRGDQFGRP